MLLLPFLIRKHAINGIKLKNFHKEAEKKTIIFRLNRNKMNNFRLTAEVWFSHGKLKYLHNV